MNATEYEIALATLPAADPHGEEADVEASMDAALSELPVEDAEVVHSLTARLAQFYAGKGALKVINDLLNDPHPAVVARLQVLGYLRKDETHGLNERTLRHHRQNLAASGSFI